jgi:hypothetical protein
MRHKWLVFGLPNCNRRTCVGRKKTPDLLVPHVNHFLNTLYIRWRALPSDDSPLCVDPGPRPMTIV